MYAHERVCTQMQKVRNQEAHYCSIHFVVSILLTQRYLSHLSFSAWDSLKILWTGGISPSASGRRYLVSILGLQKLARVRGEASGIKEGGL